MRTVAPKNFFSELKRRNVYKVAVAYAIVGWLVVQIATQVFPFLEIPNWVVRLVIGLVVIGFPIALVIAWAFELTPEGLKRTEDVDAARKYSRGGAWIYIVVIGAAVSIGLFFAGRYTAPNGSGSSSSESLGKSIAVLPFVDLSQAKDQEYFCDGISEELLGSLAKIEGLRVVARTSSFAFKGKNVSVGEIAAKLGVQHILEGSLRRDGNRIRLTAQLINARDGFHLWSQTYERELQGIFAIQDEITSAIVEALKVKLALAPPSRAPVNTDAHELYLQGLYYSNKSSEEDLRKAIGLFQQALEKDPNFSRAWTGIAKAWIWLADEYVKPLEAYPAAEAAAKKALALNPDDAHARSFLAEAKWVLNRDVTGAIAEVERALAIDPNCSEAHFILAELREAQGNCPAALAEIHATQQLDPLSAQLTSWATGVMIRCNRLEEALAFAKRTIELDPSYLYSHPPLARVYLAQGKLEEALTIYEEAARRTHPPSHGLAIAYAKLGRETGAREVLRQLVEKRKTSYVRGDSIASIYAALGEREEMFAWLEIAYDERSSSLPSIAFRVEFRPYMSDPRFVDLIRRIGLDPAALLNREHSE
jgi:adenylate cyclase